jgi:hypothetical protein
MIKWKLFAAVICGSFLILPLPGLTTRSEDENEDGIPDRWFTMNGSMVVDYTADRNFDGEVDQKTHYSDIGEVAYEEFDFNFDGAMDDFYFYNAFGELIRREIDSDYDRKVDIWVYLTDGIYVRKMERDTDNDGVADWTKEYGS